MFIFSKIVFLGCNFDINGSYFCRVLNSEQIKINLTTQDPKLRDELGMERNSNIGRFLGVGPKSGGLEKNS